MTDQDIFGVLGDVEEQVLAEAMEGSSGSDPYRVLITGSRVFPSYEFIEMVLDLFLVSDSGIAQGHGIKKLKHDRVVIVHGGAKGADTFAGQWVKNSKVENGQSIEVEVHPANWKMYKSGAGMIRNGVMVNAGAEVCIAFPDIHGSSVGTRGCMKLARSKGINVIDAVRIHWESFKS